MALAIIRVGCRFGGWRTTAPPRLGTRDEHLLYKYKYISLVARRAASPGLYRAYHERR